MEAGGALWTLVGFLNVYDHLELLAEVCFSLESTVGIQEFYNVSISSLLANKYLEATERYQGQHKIVICSFIIRREKRPVLCGYPWSPYQATSSSRVASG